MVITPYPVFDLLMFVGAVAFGNVGLILQKRPHEIHVIWLVFSFFFVVFFSVEVIAHKNHVELVEVCGSYRETCKTVYDSLTDIQDELKLIFVFLGATLIPQLLAYLLSGLSGSATAPQYIHAAREAATWSFIKFSAGLGGIFLSQPAATLFGEKVMPPAANFVPGVNYVAISFLYLLAWVTVSAARDAFYERHGYPPAVQ
jgi:hypothetical protein